jgi:hypothetical protein
VSAPDARRPVDHRPAAARLIFEERGLIAGFFIRLVLVFALLALGANEVAQIALAKIRASTAAAAAAQAGANTFRADRNVVLAKAAAEKAAEGVDSEARVTAFGIGAGGVAIATVERTANTIVVHRVSVLRHFGVYRTTDMESPET